MPGLPDPPRPRPGGRRALGPRRPAPCPGACRRLAARPARAHALPHLPHPCRTTHPHPHPTPPLPQYPALVDFHAKVAELPGIKAYLEGPLRLAQVNNNNLG
jgi:hypothetical protein